MVLSYFYGAILLSNDRSYVFSRILTLTEVISFKVTFARNLAKKFKFIFLLIQSFISVISSRS